MKPQKLLQTFLFAAVGFSYAPFASGLALKFLTTPAVQHFPDGAVEWRGSINCPDPSAFSDVRIVFTFDNNLDGIPDGNRDSTMLSAANCDSGEVDILRTLFPSRPGILTAELRQGAVLLDRKSAFAGAMGSLLSLHRFCARPTDGEPEWIEIGNPSASRVSLADIRAEGHLLAGALEPGANLLIGRDSADLLRWQPGAAIYTTSSWSSLRNTGDTLRLTWNGSVVLDSLIYGAAVDPHEGCASAPTEETVAAAAGYAMEATPAHWNPEIEPLVLKVQAPAGSKWNLSAYDLDGYEVCAISRNKSGPAEIQLTAPDCQNLVNRKGSVILQLQPTSATTIRKRIRVLRP